MSMRLLGFNFSKIYIERLDSKGENLKVNNDLNITTIDKATADFLDLEDEILAIKFNYKVNFEPNFAKIELEGNLSVSVEQKIAEEILKEWEEKKIPQNFRIRIFMIINSRQFFINIFNKSHFMHCTFKNISITFNKIF